MLLLIIKLRTMNDDGGRRRGCSPGRYFASYELKGILAHIILEYDLKLDGHGVRASDLLPGTHGALSAPDGCVLFRKREASPPR